ncbi:2-phospho-L-lactate transferase [Luteimicrobium subarcticum]|uniref:LPPG:FO 2-phospho-L-lactate transferase n=1 Tax=Luteimicrobium subarcticum TaxID=620910 RepID=A0A2M8WU57_9MICO|nr:2-phospho-L-lactate transferase [Luteimicrobium subarcticum]PJI94463.1 LPPG:FO 2-phospho-L-lactate transferase [Luteimicrobium subarcticum]
MTTSNTTTTTTTTTDHPLRVTLLAGGVGGARFTRGLRDLLVRRGVDAELTVVVNTGDDLWVDGLRVCPDLDTVLYTLAGVVHPDQGWGRQDETLRVSAELHAYGLGLPWFTLGDLDIATHVARTAMLREGVPLSAATARLSARWPLGVRLLPMSDQEVETHVELADGSGTVHFEEWWVRLRAAVPARRFVQVGVEDASPAPGVLDALASADVVLLPPSNPVVSVGTVLGVPGIREAVRTTSAPVVGVSPILGGAPVRGMADACLTTVGVETSALAVARHYGSRRASGLLDGWLVDDVDAPAVAALAADGLAARALPLLMGDDVGDDGRSATDAIVLAALDLAGVRLPG